MKNLASIHTICSLLLLYYFTSNIHDVKGPQGSNLSEGKIYKMKWFFKSLKTGFKSFLSIEKKNVTLVIAGVGAFLFCTSFQKRAQPRYINVAEQSWRVTRFGTREGTVKKITLKK